MVAFHAALILANSIFGMGSIVAALGLPATNPLAFSFVREICSGSLLLLLSALTNMGASSSDYLIVPRRIHFPEFGRLGALLFINQAAYLVGIGLAGPVTGSVWQPSAPIITVAISMLWGMEQVNARRLMGVLIAFMGDAAMVLLSDRTHDDTHGGATAFWIGNAMFLMNCSATAFYILLSKQVLATYPALTVTAWSYNLASILMMGATFLSDSLPLVLSLICPSCPASQGDGSSSMLCIPRAALPALAYYIVFQSVAAWGLILWANQYATGTLVIGYSVLQPVTSVLFTTFFLITHLVASCHESGAPTPCLNEPSLGTLCGMAGVACGLYLVVQTEPTALVIDQEQDMDPAPKQQNLTIKYGTMEDERSESPRPASFFRHTSSRDAWLSKVHEERYSS